MTVAHGNGWTMPEEWRPVPGWEGVYDVSNQGRLRSHHKSPPHILTPGTDKDGYRKAILCDAPRKSHQRVASLVALAFIGPRPPGAVIRHLDNDKDNNAVSNLAYGTQAENMADKKRHGTSQRGERSARATMTEATARRVLELHRAGERPCDLVRRFNLSRPAVYQLCARTSWKHLDEAERGMSLPAARAGQIGLFEGAL